MSKLEPVGLTGERRIVLPYSPRGIIHLTGQMQRADHSPGKDVCIERKLWQSGIEPYLQYCASIFAAPGSVQRVDKDFSGLALFLSWFNMQGSKYGYDALGELHDGSTEANRMVSLIFSPVCNYFWGYYIQEEYITQTATCRNSDNTESIENKLTK